MSETPEERVATNGTGSLTYDGYIIWVRSRVREYFPESDGFTISIESNTVDIITGQNTVPIEIFTVSKEQSGTLFVLVAASTERRDTYHYMRATWATQNRGINFFWGAVLVDSRIHFHHQLRQNMFYIGGFCSARPASFEFQLNEIRQDFGLGNMTLNLEDDGLGNEDSGAENANTQGVGSNGVDGLADRLGGVSLVDPDASTEIPDGNVENNPRNGNVGPDGTGNASTAQVIANEAANGIAPVTAPATAAAMVNDTASDTTNGAEPATAPATAPDTTNETDPAMAPATAPVTAPVTAPTTAPTIAPATPPAPTNITGNGTTNGN
ncbi:hypothetical protein BO78DRAFT_413678 [Aspergillus sclerotiicarbonarius CBS 121057]|uniref:Uncharacterized protein n=1 Tax=Aspergillus sclerotiicarbonarius (strain CBS 121057 / IBT 28362) TaxID=1448318 RepID=A0A319ELL1_ASPSB|nr:hypothetical protein BO78DRAFT_413678 [Aspergillus sclerotiicarbonarius CBS 121057]